MPVFEKTRSFMASSEEGPFTIIGIPLDLSTSYRPGTRFAPVAIREASYGLEEYDLLGGGDLHNIRFADKGDLLLSGSIEKAVEEIKEAIKYLLDSGSLPVIIGGEHLITYPVVDILSQKFKEIYIVTLDAHADMRDEYNGLRLSHATVMRRISEIIPPQRIFQFGIRSGSREEAEYYRSSGIYYSPQPPSEEFFKGLKDKDVYISIDIDVLDPAYSPGTGTPEPCGWRPEQILSFLRSLKGIRLSGFDIVEVSPPFDPSGITSLMAARIIRECLLYLT